MYKLGLVFQSNIDQITVNVTNDQKAKIAEFLLV